MRCSACYISLSHLVGGFVSDPQECTLLARVGVCKHKRTDSPCASHVVVLVCNIVLGAVMSPLGVCGAEEVSCPFQDRSGTLLVIQPYALENHEGSVYQVGSSTDLIVICLCV